MNWFYKHYRFATLPRGAILDIGSGSNPFWRANILMERFLEDDSQRPGRLIADRPIVCSDVHRILFVDKAFSFVIVLIFLNTWMIPKQQLKKCRVLQGVDTLKLLPKSMSLLISTFLSIDGL